jgi:hypothetical protein
VLGSVPDLVPTVWAVNDQPIRPQELRGTTRLRSNTLPPETLVLLRAAPVSLDDLVEQAADSGRRFTLDGEPFFGLSLSALIDGVTEDALLARPPFSGFPGFYRMTAGQLYEAGYTVWATFRRPEHHDVRLPDAAEETLSAFLVVAGELHDNGFYEA